MPFNQAIFDKLLCNLFPVKENELHADEGKNYPGEKNFFCQGFQSAPFFLNILDINSSLFSLPSLFLLQVKETPQSPVILFLRLVISERTLTSGHYAGFS